MGFILAAAMSAGSVLRDQWKEYFSVDALGDDVIAVKCTKKGRGFNHGNDNVITNGSTVAVADGQCMIIVEQGQVVDIVAEPGIYTYDNTVAPSILCGDLGKGIKAAFNEFGKRFTYGGQAAVDQRIYCFNTKEMTGQRFGTPNPVPFRVIDARAGIDIDISVRCFGSYSIRIADPIRFYTNNAGNFKDEYRVDEISGQLKSELLNVLQPAFAKISETGIRYSQLPGKTVELTNAVKEQLKDSWSAKRGIAIDSVAIASISADPEDEKMLKQMQRNAAYTDQNLAAATLVGAQAQAMQDAANNSNGAAMGFMSMNMAGSGTSASQLYQQAAANNTANTSANTWTCPNCGTTNTGNFCSTCGTKRPSDKWICPNCHQENTGSFCSNCGTKKPA